MNTSREEKLKENAKKFSNVSIISAPGTLMVGVGLSSKFSGQVMHPILENESVINALLVIGGAIMLWAFLKTIALLREKNDIVAKR